MFESVVEKPITKSKEDDFDRAAVNIVSSAKVKTSLHRSYLSH